MAEPRRDITKSVEPEIVNDAPQASRTGMRLVAQSTETTIYSGPIPHPEILHGYEQICPGAADRIIAMAENQQNHRISMEKIVVTGNVEAQARGQWIAGLISTAVLAVGTYSIYLGHPVEGASIIGTNLAAVAYVFITGKKAQEKERDERRKIQSGEEPNKASESKPSEKSNPPVNQRPKRRGRK